MDSMIVISLVHTLFEIKIRIIFVVIILSRQFLLIYSLFSWLFIWSCLLSIITSSSMSIIIVEFLKLFKYIYMMYRMYRFYMNLDHHLKMFTSSKSYVSVYMATYAMCHYNHFSFFICLVDIAEKLFIT